MAEDFFRAMILTEEVKEQIVDAFEYHPWDADQVARGAKVRIALENAVAAIVENVPATPQRTRAINHIIDSRMLSNSAITHRGKL